MIYFGKRYTATISGSVWKRVLCQQCTREFVYLLTRNGTGSGSSPYYLDNEGAQQRAQRAAVTNLQKKLKVGMDAVPCPDCGVYQDSMVARMRRQQWGWLHVVGWILAGVTLFLAWVVWITEGGLRPGPFWRMLASSPVIGGVALAVSAIALSWIGRSFYDPNVDAAGRAGAQEKGTGGPFRLEEFEAMLRQVAESQPSPAGHQFGEHDSSSPGPTAPLHRVQCRKCEQSFVTSDRDRCPLCGADWTSAPPMEVS